MSMSSLIISSCLFFAVLIAVFLLLFCFRIRYFQTFLFSF